MCPVLRIRPAAGETRRVLRHGALRTLATILLVLAFLGAGAAHQGVAAPRTPVDRTPPTLRITGPAPGAVVSGMVRVSAVAGDPRGVARVVVGIDGDFHAAWAPGPVYRHSWQTRRHADGKHRITVVAVDTAGNRRTAAVTVVVHNGPLSQTQSTRTRRKAPRAPTEPAPAPAPAPEPAPAPTEPAPAPAPAPEPAPAPAPEPAPAPAPEPAPAPAPEPAPAPAPTQPTVMPARERFGISEGGRLAFMSSTDQTRYLDLMKSMGATWLRMDFPWSVIESSPGAYQWSRWDNVVRMANQRGIKVLGIIVYTPGWARPTGADSERWAPQDPAAYGRFAGMAAQRFAPMGVHAWEIWNEPNIAPFFKPAPDAAKYALMLRSAYTAIKASDPSAVVVTGGTSPAADNGTDISPVTWLKTLYANGARGSFDAVGHHPYTFPAYPGETQGWNAWFQMTGASVSLRTVMESNGDGAKQIWGTESGAPSLDPNHTSLSETTQAETIRRGYALWSTFSWAGPLFTYSLRDLTPNTATRESWFGLVRNDWTPKPSYDAYTRAVAATP